MTGDIPRFFAGDPTAGDFMTGFFPIMMFALPAAALAIWHEARPAQKKAVGGIMIGAALTSFLTGVTEPLEFSFMFVAFPLYVLHALLTGTSIALTNALDIHDGFGFSAGLFDFVLNWNIADETGAPDRDRVGLCGGLLLPVPGRHPLVEPQDARPRGRGRREQRDDDADRPGHESPTRRSHLRTTRQPDRTRASAVHDVRRARG